MRTVTATEASERGGWSRREAGPGERWDAYDALAPESFLNQLARRLGTSAWDLLEDQRMTPPMPEPRRREPEKVDATVFHSRLMPPGWSERASFAEFAPGSLFTLAG